MVYFNKRTVIIVSVFIIIAIAFGICFDALSSHPAGSAEIKVAKVVLDAGHGGIDGGVTGVTSGIRESELNLDVVKKLEKYLVDAGMVVVLTRSTDAGLYGIASGNLKRKDMEKRKDIINNASPTLVVSVHMNKYSLSTRRGAQVFYKENDDSAKILANCVQESFNSMEGATRKYSPLSGDYYILNCSTYPSIIAECGFLSNPQDEALLLTDEYRDAVAYAIFKGIVNYLSVNSFNFFK